MKKRKKLPKRASKRLFKGAARTKSRNNNRARMRGGIRL